MKKRLLLSALTCGLLLGTMSIEAKTPTKTLMQNQIKQHSTEQMKVSKEVVEGFQATLNSVKLIETDKVDEAKTLLQKASNDFEKVMKVNPELDLLPLEESVAAYSFSGSSAVIEDTLKLSTQLIKAHDTQTAITVLSALKDELDINIVAVPMKLYADSVKIALKSLNKGDKKAALSALSIAFGTLVESQIVIPTPLLTAEDLVLSASKLDKSKKEEAKKLLDLAKEELKRAELLGYTKKHDGAYKLLNEGIDKIEKEIKGKNMVAKLYEKLKNDFKSIIHNVRIEKVKKEKVGFHDSVAKEEAKALKNPQSVKGEAAAAAKVEEMQNKEEFLRKEAVETFEKEAKQDSKKVIAPQ